MTNEMAARKWNQRDELRRSWAPFVVCNCDDRSFRCSRRPIVAIIRAAPRREFALEESLDCDAKSFRCADTLTWRRNDNSNLADDCKCTQRRRDFEPLVRRN